MGSGPNWILNCGKEYIGDIRNPRADREVMWAIEMNLWEVRERKRIILANLVSYNIRDDYEIRLETRQCSMYKTFLCNLHKDRE